MKRILNWLIDHPFVSLMVFGILILAGFVVMPFDVGGINIAPIGVDAIPDLGENQQIVITEWPGYAPQDIEDQITYPLSTYLLGTTGVKTVRSTSMFGVSFIHVIFEASYEYYWTRARLLERLNAIPPGLLPEGVKPQLGPDATSVGQIFWYTVEAVDEDGNIVPGGWSLDELRSVQDFLIRYALNGVEGVAEVVSIGGHVREYQIELIPSRLVNYRISIEEVIKAVKDANRTVGAQTMEFNSVEYFIRGLGYVTNLKDLEDAVITYRKGVAIRIKDVAQVTLGPAPRRGGLDKNGQEVVGGVVISRYGANPMRIIKAIKQEMDRLNQSLPQKILPNGKVVRMQILPFYDRTKLIKETLGTLWNALSHEMLISIVVIIVLLLHIPSALLVVVTLPLAILLSFVFMAIFKVDANLVSITGIAIAIGTMVDIAIVFTESVLRTREAGLPLTESIKKGIGEVFSAMIVATGTTVVSFLPVFFFTETEGKLFKPLAFTKTFAMISALLIGIFLLPVLMRFVFQWSDRKKHTARIPLALGILLMTLLLYRYTRNLWVWLLLSYIPFSFLPPRQWHHWFQIGVSLFLAFLLLTEAWFPLGPQVPFWINWLFVAGIVFLILATMYLFQHFYPRILPWSVRNPGKFFILPVFTLFFGALCWLGAERILYPLQWGLSRIGIPVESTSVWKWLKTQFPGLPSQFMPALDEGSFLLMPTTMPHSGVELNKAYCQTLDYLVSQIPEVEGVLGKWGRIPSALDPAPINMFENIVIYKSEYAEDEHGNRIRFKVDEQNRYILKNGGYYDPREGFRVIDTALLIRDDDGLYLRQWRPHIHTTDDIWREIERMARLPGMTGMPKLHPIETRLIMLQSGMRGNMGIKLYGSDLATLERVGIQMEKIIKQVPEVQPSTVFAERIVAKPYIQIEPKREALAYYGSSVDEVMQNLEYLLGGKTITTSIEGRERYPIRIRYPRSERDDPASLKNLLIETKAGQYVPLGQICDIFFQPGPQAIKSENTYLTSYVIFDKKPGYADDEVILAVEQALQRAIQSGDLILPTGVRYEFSGNYLNQQRAKKTLMLLIPLTLSLVFLLLYFQFRSLIAAFIHFSGVFIAWAGGFILLWLYGQDWFLNFSITGVSFRELFQVQPVYLTTAVWVGFIALFGIATDDGVLMGTYLHETFLQRQPVTNTEIEEAVLEAGRKRVRAAVMTVATTLIALLPILTSTGRGSELMIPMAIPTFGGMLIQMMTMFSVPVLQSIWRKK
jgi:Cu(I)/Ag(I) efflux system membrane protein CusA/SilA